MNLKDYVAEIPDFPSEGILFRDVTPMMQDQAAYKESIDQLVAYAKGKDVDVIASPEARGFLFGCPVAVELGAGFVPVRKPGKLPRETVSVEYSLEYGTNEIFMHKDAIKPGQRVLVVDDLLATGGTVNAAVKLVEQMGGIVVGCAFVITLDDLNGEELLAGHEVFSLLHY